MDEEVSLYYIANEIITTYHGMMIAIPEPEWDVFYSMSTAGLAAILVELAQGVRLPAFRKVLEGLRNLILRGKSQQGRDMFQRLNCSRIVKQMWSHLNITGIYTYGYRVWCTRRYPYRS